nr:hypothetical protein [uncultured Draconibacterium sp.]
MKEQEENKLNETWETPEVNVILVEETEAQSTPGGVDGGFFAS